MQSRGRPKKVRYIQRMPKVTLFSPRGKPGRPDEILLTIDQYEALKLADHQGFDQTQGAIVMKVSRPSFGRILREARRRVADAIVNGKIIKIGIGDTQIGVRSKEFISMREIGILKERRFGDRRSQPDRRQDDLNTPNKLP
ncbi:MAG TPA: DUF134 domain-containing protein [Candidatus Omnitrophota bacterium]|nr:DUF134 domain-containing protein [Candidatus Omnitrophota bacterium]